MSAQAEDTGSTYSSLTKAAVCQHTPYELAFAQQVQPYQCCTGRRLKRSPRHCMRASHGEGTVQHDIGPCECMQQGFMGPFPKHRWAGVTEKAEPHYSWSSLPQGTIFAALHRRLGSRSITLHAVTPRQDACKSDRIATPMSRPIDELYMIRSVRLHTMY